MRLAGHPKATWGLAGVAFAESSFFPIPPDVMLLPMVLADRARAWYFATIATVASVLGGVAGYAIGYFLLDLVGRPILRLYGLENGFAEFAAWFNTYGVWVIIIKGMTPIPYKVLTITAGAVHMDLVSFAAASVVARAMRFFLVAGLLYFFGAPIREFVEKRLMLVTSVSVVFLFAGFIVLKYLR